jgi:hypothetical protein
VARKAKDAAAAGEGEEARKRPAILPGKPTPEPA